MAEVGAGYDPRTYEPLTFHDAARRFESGEDTPRDFLERCLATIAERDPVVRAFAHLNPDLARAAADEPLSPIDGMPVGIKDLLETKDMPTEYGCQAFEPRRVPKPLTGLTGTKIREDVIVRNWPDILRVAATLASGVLPPSQLLRKFAAYPRQHELAVALHEIGRVERTLFIVDWLLDSDMQRRTNTGLNKAEAHQERPPHRAPERNPRPHQRRATLSHGWAEPGRRHRHLLEYCASRRSDQTAAVRWPDGRSRAGGPHLAPGLGSRTADRGIPAAETPPKWPHEFPSLRNGLLATRIGGQNP